MAYTCERIERPQRATLVLRTRTPVERLPAVLGPAWHQIMEHAGKAGASPSGPPFVAYHNMDMNDLELEIGMPFSAPIDGAGDVRAGEIPAGPVAFTVHVGPYDRIEEAYEALQAWMSAAGYVPAGPPSEWYVDDPQEVPTEELRTHVEWPIREA